MPPGLQTRLIRAGTLVPYVMHRMGSETRHCPCDCGGPLQATRLQDHGAFTVLVMRKHPPAADTEGIRATLPSCAEVAALL
eukprot:7925866-Prorocentrum_lima.AAC.1